MPDSLLMQIMTDAHEVSRLLHELNRAHEHFEERERERHHATLDAIRELRDEVRRKSA